MRIWQLVFILAPVLLAACDGGGSTGPSSPPAALQAAFGDGQSAAVNTQLPLELVVRVLNAQGEPVHRASVQWQLTQGGGTLVPITTTTDVNGQARASLKLGTAAGNAVVTAVVGGLSVEFHAYAGPGQITAVVVAPGPDTLAVQGQVTLTAQAADAYGNRSSAPGVQWSTSNSAVATVNGQGVVTATGLGSATITARLENGASGSTQVVVMTRAPTASTRPFQPGNASTGSANVNGDVSPNGLSTTAWIEWGTDPTFATFQQLPQPPRQVPTLNQPFALEVVLKPISGGVTYYYRIVAQNALGTTRGNIQSFTIPVAAASGVQAAVVADSLMVRLTWHVDANTRTTWVERRIQPGAAWESVADTAYISGGTYTYLDVTYPIDADTTIEYRVLACSYGHACFPSAPVQVHAPGLHGPVGLSATADAAHHVVLTWQDQDAIETGWAVIRYANLNSRPDFVVQLPANTTTYSDVATTAGYTYQYYVDERFSVTIPSVGSLGGPSFRHTQRSIILTP